MKKKSKKPRRSELLEYQLSYVVDRSIYKTVDSRIRAVSKARRQFLYDGTEISGVKIIGRWRNPENRNPRHSNWKTTADPGQSLPDFYKTLHGDRGALRGAATATTAVGTMRPDYSRQRSSAMKQYHATLREMIFKNPLISYSQARTLYRKRFKK